MWLSIALFSVLLFFCLRRWWKYQQIKRWRSALALEQHGKVFNQLYCSINGFVLSQASRNHHDRIDYTYGEIDFESFIALLALCHPDSSTVFYDLGSGTGKAVLACAMVFNVQKSCGIELFPALHACAIAQKTRLEHHSYYLAKAKCIKLVQGNFLSISYEDATLIFINATAFFGSSWIQISKHLEKVKPGTLILSTSKKLNSPLFKIVRITKVKMSWGIVNAFIQERNKLVNKKINT